MHFNSTIYFLFVSLFIAVYNLFNSLFSELGVRQFFNVATTSDNYTDNAHNEPVAVKWQVFRLGPGGREVLGNFAITHFEI